MSVGYFQFTQSSALRENFRKTGCPPVVYVTGAFLIYLIPDPQTTDQGIRRAGGTGFLLDATGTRRGVVWRPVGFGGEPRDARRLGRLAWRGRVVVGGLGFP